MNWCQRQKNVYIVTPNVAILNVLKMGRLLGRCEAHASWTYKLAQFLSDIYSLHLTWVPTLITFLVYILCCTLWHKIQDSKSSRSLKTAEVEMGWFYRMDFGRCSFFKLFMFYNPLWYYLYSHTVGKSVLTLKSGFLYTKIAFSAVRRRIQEFVL